MPRTRSRDSAAKKFPCFFLLERRYQEVCVCFFFCGGPFDYVWLDLEMKLLKEHVFFIWKCIVILRLRHA